MGVPPRDASEYEAEVDIIVDVNVNVDVNVDVNVNPASTINIPSSPPLIKIYSIIL